MTLLAPGFLLLLIPVGLLAAGYALFQRRRPRFVVRFTAMDLLEEVVPEAPRWRRHLPPVLVLVGLLALVVGLARPAITLRRPQAAAVTVALDVSPSMLADDVAPTRLAAARRAISRFLATAPPDVHVGLVDFAGTAHLRVPPTTDHTRVGQVLDGLEVRSETALGEAVYTAVDSLMTTAAEPGTAGGVLLLSDGGSTTGPSAGSAVQRAVEENLPVWTVAFGTSRGRVRLSGETVEVPVNGQSLEQIAEGTGGEHLEAATVGELTGVLSDLRSELSATEAVEDVSAWVLLGGFLALLAAAALGLRWFGRLP